MGKYLVTGGTGFIGNGLVKRLISSGHKVRVLDNSIRGDRKRIHGLKAELVEADIRDAKAVEKACRGMDGVFHLAFINGTEFFYKRPELVLDVGVKGMVNVIDGCIKNNVKEIILASSSEVYQTPKRIPTDEKAELSIPDPLNPRYSYAGGKIISELITVNFGRKNFERAMIFRPHNVYGPDMGWEHVIPQFVVRMKELSKTSEKKVKFPIQGNGRQTRAFIYIEDFLDGVMKMFEKGKHMEIYHIGTMEEVRITEVAKEIGKFYGKDVEIVPGKEAAGGTMRRCPDISKIKKLGFEPKVKFRDGVRLTAKWYDENSEKRPKEGLNE